MSLSNDCCHLYGSYVNHNGQPLTCFEEFENQMEVNGDQQNQPMLIETNGTMKSYNDLKCSISGIVNLLILNGCTKADKPIAVFLPPGCGRIAVFLSLNYLGIPYVPLDPVQAIEQRNYILQHCEAQALLTMDGKFYIQHQSNS